MRVHMGISCAVCCAYWLAQSRGDFRVPADSFCFRTTTSTRHGFPVCACLSPGVILTIAYIIRERKAAFDIFKSTRDFFGIILFAIFGVGLCQYAYLEAIHHTNAGIATALQYLAPVMVLIISCVRRLRPPKFREIVAVLLAVGGTFLIATHGNIHQMSISKEGLKWGLLAAFGFCMYTLLPERMLKKWGSQPGRWLWHADLWRGI